VKQDSRKDYEYASVAPAPTGHRENCPGGEWRRYAGQAVCFPLVSFGSNQLNPLMGTLKTTEQWTIILYGDWPCVFGLNGAAACINTIFLLTTFSLPFSELSLVGLTFDVVD